MKYSDEYNSWFIELLLKVGIMVEYDEPTNSYFVIGVNSDANHFYFYLYDTDFIKWVKVKGKFWKAKLCISFNDFIWVDSNYVFSLSNKTSLVVVDKDAYHLYSKINSSNNFLKIYPKLETLSNFFITLKQ